MPPNMTHNDFIIEENLIAPIIQFQRQTEKTSDRFIMKENEIKAKKSFEEKISYAEILKAYKKRK